MLTALTALIGDLRDRPRARVVARNAQWVVEARATPTVWDESHPPSARHEWRDRRPITASGATAIRARRQASIGPPRLQSPADRR